MSPSADPAHQRLPAHGLQSGITRPLISLVVGFAAALAVWASGTFATAQSFEVQASSNFDGDALHVTATVKPVVDDEIRAWFFLADPDEREPWRRNVYQSEVLEQTVTAEDGASFVWNVPALAVRPGVYAVTIWFHDFDGDQWTHLDGGTYGMKPIELR